MAPQVPAAVESLFDADAVIDGAFDAFVAVDRDGRITKWNTAAEALFGWDRLEVLGRPLVDVIIPPEHRAAHQAGLVRASTTGEARILGRRLELPALTRSGRVVVELTIGRSGAHSDSGYAAFLRDVTGVRAAERRLREAEQRFRLAFDDAPIGMALVSTQGQWLRANAALSRLVGYSAADLATKTFQDITHPDDLDRDLELMGRVLAGDIDFYEMEKRYLRADGSCVWVLLAVSVVRDDGGAASYFISQIQDIDARKRLVEDLRETNEELQAALHAKDDFLANMSHELRTPLNAILGFTELLQMELPGPLNNDQQQQVGIVHSNGRHLLSLINDLLDLAKLQSGRMDLAVEDVDAAAVLEEITSTLQPLAAQKALQLTHTVPGGGCWVLADRRALSQILLNLTGNAIKFTDTGSVRLCVETTSRGTRWSVSDTGPGMTEHDQVRLFEAYEQAGEDHVRRQGTGLGLHISQRLAHLMGGTLSVHSTPGHGSTFRLDLPDPAADRRPDSGFDSGFDSGLDGQAGG